MAKAKRAKSFNKVLNRKLPKWIGISLTTLILVAVGSVVIFFTISGVYNHIQNRKADAQFKQDFADAPQITMLKEITGKRIIKETSDARITIKYEDLRLKLEEQIKFDQDYDMSTKDDQKLLDELNNKFQSTDEIVILENEYKYEIDMGRLLSSGKAMVFDKTSNTYVDWIKVVGWDNFQALSGFGGTYYCLPSSEVFFDVISSMS